jgi:hypothetical protein
MTDSLNEMPFSVLNDIAIFVIGLRARGVPWPIATSCVWCTHLWKRVESL